PDVPPGPPEPSAQYTMPDARSSGYRETAGWTAVLPPVPAQPQAPDTISSATQRRVGIGSPLPPVTAAAFKQPGGGGRRRRPTIPLEDATRRARDRYERLVRC